MQKASQVNWMRTRAPIFAACSQVRTSASSSFLAVDRHYSFGKYILKVVRLVGRPYSSEATISSQDVREARKPSYYWKSLENQRAFMERLRETFGIKEGDFLAWYKITTKKVVDNGGYMLISQYNTSIAELLRAMYPEHNWSVFSQQKKPQNFWTLVSNQRLFMENIGKNLGIKVGDWNVWTQLRPKDLIDNGGLTLYRIHGNSMTRLLQTIFPEHEWNVEKADGKKPHRHWDLQKQRTLMDEIGSKLGIKEGDFEAWYQVGVRELMDQGARSLLLYHRSSPSNLIRKTFPEHNWDISRFRRSHSLRRSHKSTNSEIQSDSTSLSDLK